MKGQMKGNIMKSNTVEVYLAERPPLDLAALEIIFLFSFFFKIPASTSVWIFVVVVVVTNCKEIRNTCINSI